MTSRLAWTPAPLRVDKVLISYAQNAEDIRLIRVFGSASAGFYVDVGAGDPVEDSVTKLLYDRGWSGINIEPGPQILQLETDRRRDVNLAFAVAPTEETREFWTAVPDSGISTFYPPAADQAPDGFRFESRLVECRPLWRILDEHAKGREIDVLKVDVEGAEEDVLRSFDLHSTRPTVLIVEAVAPFTLEPSHDSWEPLVLGADYVFAVFDGVNRFYVPRESRELVDALAYPISPLDNYVRRGELELRHALSHATGALEEERQLAATAFFSARQLSELDVRDEVGHRQDGPRAPIVLIETGGSREELLATFTSLSRHTEEPFAVGIVDSGTRDVIVHDATLRDAGSPEALAGIVGQMVERSAAASITDVRTLLTSTESDLVVVQSGVVLSPRWLERLRAVAYSDSVCASSSALVESATGDEETGQDGEEDQPSIPFPPALDAPAWGVVYIRRDVLNLTAWKLLDDGYDLSLLPALEDLIVVPGVVHRLAHNVVVRSSPTPSRERLPRAAGRNSGDLPSHVAPPGMPAGVRVMVDGRCLDRPLSGTQVHVLSLLKALSDTDAIALSVLLPHRVHDTVEQYLSTIDTPDGSYTYDRLPETMPAIFHRPYQFSTADELDVCRRIGQRLVLTHQDMILDRTSAYHASLHAWESFRATTASAFRAADQVGFFSRHAAWDAASDGTLHADRINVVPLGVDHPLDSSRSEDRVSESFPDLEGTPFLLFVGGALRHKNRLFALQAFDYLTNVLGWTGKLVLAGDHPERGSSIPDEQAYLAGRAADEHAVLDLGRVTDAQKRWLYAHAQLVLFPSLYEGFGLVPFEAASCGTPCVYGWRSSLPEYLPREGGVLEGWELPRSTAAMLELIEDPARAARLVDSICEAGSYLTWARTAAGYLDVYRRALATPPRSSSWNGDPPLVLQSAGSLPKNLSTAEIRLLDLYRRRRLFRASIEGAIESGLRILDLWRAVRARTRRRSG